MLELILLFALSISSPNVVSSISLSLNPLYSKTFLSESLLNPIVSVRFLLFNTLKSDVVSKSLFVKSSFESLSSFSSFLISKVLSSVNIFSSVKTDSSFINI